MTERNNDDLAAALAGLHSGEHPEPEEGHDAHDVEAHLHDGGHASDAAHPAGAAAAPPPPPAPSAPVPRTRPITGVPVPAAPVAKGPAPTPRQVANPAAPQNRSSRAPAPVPPNAPAARAPRPPSVPVPPRPAGAAPRPPGAGAPPAPASRAPVPGVPSTPAARPPSSAPQVPRAPAPARPRTSRPITPTSPARPAKPSVFRPARPGEIAPTPAAVTDDSGPVDEDDQVIVPAPPTEYLAQTHHAPAAPTIPFYKRLTYQRTMIPILLTCGVSFLALGVSRWLCDPDTGLGGQPLWMAGLFILGAIVSATLGVVTMLHVKRRLATPTEAK